MFIALDKLINQGVKKVIVAVHERSIGGSFAKTNRKEHGFYADWEPNDKYNLCTHATPRFACEELDEEKFNNVLLAIDEFHHVSADVNSRLGETCPVE